ncbi:hypothetical protein JCM5296_005624, partial [Sporobolomyces johnsonii]
SCQQGVVHHIQHCPHDAFSYWVAFREAFAPTDAQGALRLLRRFWRVSLPAATPEAFDSFSKEFTEVLSALKAADVDLAMVYSSHLLAALPPALDSLQTTISVSNPVALPSTDALLELIRNEILRASSSSSPAPATPIDNVRERVQPGPKPAGAPRSAATKPSTRQQLTHADWLRVFAYIDQHPSLSQSGIVHHFSSLRIDALHFSQATLSRQISKRSEIEAAVAHGEAASAPITEVVSERERITQIMADFRPEDRYNCDETAFFLQYLSGEKVVKFRVTALICTNQTGMDKRPPLYIGKSANPRCFRGKEKPKDFQYTSSEKAWMTSKLYEQWIIKLDAEMGAKGHQILLLHDNFSGHRIAIKMVFFGPNLTAFVQPCDTGIIRTMKALYRRNLVPAVAHSGAHKTKDPKRNPRAWDLIVTFAQGKARYTNTEDRLKSLLKHNFRYSDWAHYLNKINSVEHDNDEGELAIAIEVQHAAKAALGAIDDGPVVDQGPGQPSQLARATEGLEAAVAELQECRRIIGDPLSLSELLNPDELVASEAGQVSQAAFWFGGDEPTEEELLSAAAQEVRAESQPLVDSDSEDSSQEDLAPTISLAEAQRCANECVKFLEGHASSEEDLALLSQIRRW